MQCVAFTSAERTSEKIIILLSIFVLNLSSNNAILTFWNLCNRGIVSGPLLIQFVHRSRNCMLYGPIDYHFMYPKEESDSLNGLQCPLIIRNGNTSIQRSCSCMMRGHVNCRLYILQCYDSFSSFLDLQLLLASISYNCQAPQIEIFDMQFI